jgi:hypothetical protein
MGRLAGPATTSKTAADVAVSQLQLMVPDSALQCNAGAMQTTTDAAAAAVADADGPLTALL